MIRLFVTTSITSSIITSCSASMQSIAPVDRNMGAIFQHNASESLGAPSSSLHPSSSSVTISPPDLTSALDRVKQQKSSYPDIRLSEAQIDAILSDGMEHSFTVVFHDRYRVRARKASAGDKQSMDGNTLVSEVNDLGVNEGIEILLDCVDLSYIEAFRTIGRSQADLDHLEQQVQQGFSDDVPNSASIITLGINGYTAVKARKLARLLSVLPVVRSFSLSSLLIPPGVLYRNPPSDPYFPASNREANDLLNSEDLVNGSTTHPWWWNRHSIGVALENAYGKGSGIKVAAIDSAGFLPPEQTDGLRYDIANARNLTMYGDNTDWGRRGSHGTAAASLVGAASDNGIGLCGAAPAATILPLKIDVEDSLARAIDCAASQK